MKIESSISSSSGFEAVAPAGRTAGAVATILVRQRREEGLGIGEERPEDGPLQALAVSQSQQHALRGACADEEEVRRVGLLREVEDFAEEGVLVAAALGADFRFFACFVPRPDDFRLLPLYYFSSLLVDCRELETDSASFRRRHIGTVRFAKLHANLISCHERGGCVRNLQKRESVQKHYAFSSFAPGEAPAARALSQ